MRQRQSYPTDRRAIEKDKDKARMERCGREQIRRGDMKMKLRQSYHHKLEELLKRIHDSKNKVEKGKIIFANCQILQVHQ